MIKISIVYWCYLAIVKIVPSSNLRQYIDQAIWPNKHFEIIFGIARHQIFLTITTRSLMYTTILVKLISIYDYK